jgi:azurin
MKVLCLTTALALLISPLGFAEPKTEPKKEEAAKKTPDVTLEISGNDTMQFDKKTLEVTEGQVVQLTFKNAGNLPKEAMGHNVVILKAGKDLMKFALAASKPENRANGFLPTDKETKDQILANTKLLGPGESDSVIFTAPAPGKYEYLCSFPGHFALMRGVLTVKAK